MRASVTVAGEKILLDELADLKTKTGRKVTRVVLQSALKVIAKQMQRDLDPKVKEAGKAVGTKVTIYRQNITRAKVGFNVGKNARHSPVHPQAHQQRRGWYRADERALVHCRHGKPLALRIQGTAASRQDNAQSQSQTAQVCQCAEGRTGQKINRHHAGTAAGAGGKCCQKIGL